MAWERLACSGHRAACEPRRACKGENKVRYWTPTPPCCTRAQVASLHRTHGNSLNLSHTLLTRRYVPALGAVFALNPRLTPSQRSHRVCSRVSSAHPHPQQTCDTDQGDLHLPTKQTVFCTVSAEVHAEALPELANSLPLLSIAVYDTSRHLSHERSWLDHPPPLSHYPRSSELPHPQLSKEFKTTVTV